MSMTRDDQQRAICAGKKVYTDWVVAKRVAHQVARRHKKPFSAYRCAICGRLHIGSDKSNWRTKQFKQRRRELEEHERDDD